MRMISDNYNGVVGINLGGYGAATLNNSGDTVVNTDNQTITAQGAVPFVDPATVPASMADVASAKISITEIVIVAASANMLIHFLRHHSSSPARSNSSRRNRRSRR